MGLTCNFQEVLNTLEELERKAQKEISSNALNAGADISLNAQINNSPEDTRALKEHLEKSDVKGVGSEAKINIGVVSDDEDIKARAWWQEYGSEVMVGKKWMKQAWNKSIKEVSEAIKESIVKDLTSK